MIKNKKILITGINGFLGTNLAKKLQNDNDIIGINQPNKSKKIGHDIPVIEGDLSNKKILKKLKTKLILYSILVLQHQLFYLNKILKNIPITQFKV